MATKRGLTLRRGARVEGAVVRDETTFGALLRRYRLAATLSQEALAERAGISAVTVRALERGRHGAPQPETLARLAAALGLATADRAALVAAATRAQSDPVGTPPPADEHAPSTLVAAAPAAGESLPVARPAPRHNLPAALSALVGREREQAAVLALLGAARLVTLVGSGGVGKTRLALAAATAALERYADGVWLVGLAPLADPALVPATAAAALGVREEPGRPLPATLASALRERELLLLLDNCEHLVAACAALAQGLLAACPRLRLLATSREALGLPGEQRYRVPSLTTPDRRHLPAAELAGSFEAVRLFAARARERAPSFSLEGPQARAVMEVCARLDGIPLAIELAAAWVGLLPVEAIAARLDDRLALLTKGARTAPSRQQTLRATLDWGWELLPEPERALLARLSVFAGGWTLAAAQQVCALAGAGEDEWAVLGGLAALEERSLLVREEQGPRAAAAGEGRYRLLETVRQYAAERLAATGEAPAIRDRHLAYYLALAEAAAPQLTGPEQGQWLDRLEEEHDDLRAALAWARERGAADEGLRLASALAAFWEERGHVREGREWLESLLRGLPESDDQGPLATLRARGLATTAWLAFLQGDYQGAAPLAERSLILWHTLDRAGNSPVALNTLAYVAGHQGDLTRQETLFRESLALCQAQGDTQGSAAVLSWLGTLRRCVDDLDGATALLEESLALYREVGNTGGIAYALLHLGGVEAARRNDERAQALFEQSLALYRDLGDSSDVAYALGALAGIAAVRGDFVRARTLCDESLARFRQLGDARGLAVGLSVLGRIAALQGDDQEAIAAFVECLTLSHAAVRADLVLCLQGLARMLARQAAQHPSSGQMERAVRLFGAVAALRETFSDTASRGWSLVPVPESRDEYERQVAATRAALGEDAFAAAWAAGRQLPLEEAIAAANAAAPPPFAGTRNPSL